MCWENYSEKRLERRKGAGVDPGMPVGGERSEAGQKRAQIPREQKRRES